MLQAVRSPQKFPSKEAQNISEVTENRCAEVTQVEPAWGHWLGSCCNTLSHKGAEKQAAFQVHSASSRPLPPFCFHALLIYSQVLSPLGGYTPSSLQRSVSALCPIWKSKVSAGKISGTHSQRIDHKLECYRSQAVYEIGSSGPLQSRKACTLRVPGARSLKG